jgi:hypothetical protein
MRYRDSITESLNSLARLRLYADRTEAHLRHGELYEAMPDLAEAGEIVRRLHLSLERIIKAKAAKLA